MPIKLEQEVDGIAIDYEGGIPARIEALCR
jgi:hypothetical protein